MEESQDKAQEKEVLNFADLEIRCISTLQLGGGGGVLLPKLGQARRQDPSTWDLELDSSLPYKSAK